jgi:FeS assembly SUF system regulator
MLRVSKLSDYATVVLGHLAAAPGRVRPAADLAEAARLELPTVSKVLKLLGTAGLVESYRGVSGGYRLARPPAQISVAQIVEAIDGPIGMTQCAVHAGQCSHEVHCGVRGPWQRISEVVVRSLREISLAEMIAPAPAPAPTPAPDDPARIAIRLA